VYQKRFARNSSRSPNRAVSHDGKGLVELSRVHRIQAARSAITRPFAKKDSGIHLSRLSIGMHVVSARLDIGPEKVLRPRIAVGRCHSGDLRAFCMPRLDAMCLEPSIKVRNGVSNGATRLDMGRPVSTALLCRAKKTNTEADIFGRRRLCKNPR
jgi:hypothetical protein